MSKSTRKPAPLEFKPDIEETARRWEAYYASDIIDRPIISVTAPVEGAKRVPFSGYRDRVYGDMDKIIDNALFNASITQYLGESVPSFWLSFGPDEIPLFCGPQEDFVWNDESGETNWSKPWVEDWEDALPLRLNEQHPLWRRMIEFYRRAAEKMGGKILLSHIDLHTNMDILAPIRGPERLCTDLVDRPEVIDRAMADARAVFSKVWHAIAEAGRMEEFGYPQGMYSPEGAAILQCDFCCMIGPEMFRRWVLPALEEEAGIVKHAFFHWDGPGALKHFDDIIGSRGLHTMGYVPDPGVDHEACMDLYHRIQAGGKGVSIGGSVDQIKAWHRELRPEKTIYSTGVGTRAEAEQLLEWFVKHT